MNLHENTTHGIPSFIISGGWRTCHYEPIFYVEAYIAPEYIHKFRNLKQETGTLLSIVALKNYYWIRLIQKAHVENLNGV